jgi:hypothetical protein
MRRKTALDACSVLEASSTVTTRIFFPSTPPVGIGFVNRHFDALVGAVAEGGGISGQRSVVPSTMSSPS